jgi:iron(III) transport system ATP-binding protein
MLETRDLTIRFGGHVAVDGVSCAFAPGTLTAIVGPNGAGKTTYFNLISGQLRASAGSVHLDGADITALPVSARTHRGLGRAFQLTQLFPHLSVLENVRYGLVVSGTARAEADDRARSTLATVGLPGFDARLPSELSGGQQQRVAVARALVLEPAVLLFDEPLSNLDAWLRRQMRDEIRELQQRLSLTVVYVTHDQAEAMAVSDRIVVMNRAVIAQEGAPRDLYERPRDPFVAGFMGDANRVRGVLARRDGDLGDVHIGAVTLRLPHRGLPDGEVEIAIRPEAIELVDATEAPIRGTVRKASYLGGLMEYTLDTDVGELFATSLAVDCPRPPGSAVGVKLTGHGVVVIPGVGV